MKQLQQVITLLDKRWDFNIEHSTIDSEGVLHKVIAAKIDEMIQRDYDRLLSMLYRLDIDEEKLASALKLKPQSKSNERIAELIIQREKQRAHSWHMYERRRQDQA